MLPSLELCSSFAGCPPGCTLCAVGILCCCGCGVAVVALLGRDCPPSRIPFDSKSASHHLLAL
eukprot:921775-Rhodomonas_salina.1